MKNNMLSRPQSLQGLDILIHLRHRSKFINFISLEALGLSKPIPKPEPKKRVRKKKESVEKKPKRPRGRPGKNLVNAIDKLL